MELLKLLDILPELHAGMRIDPHKRLELF